MSVNRTISSGVTVRERCAVCPTSGMPPGQMSLRYNPTTIHHNEVLMRRSLNVAQGFSPAVACVVIVLVIPAFGALPMRSQAQAKRGPFDALHFRDIGPAATGGRIHDIAIDPANPPRLYGAAGNGGIWKTTNKGVTWKDVFVQQPDSAFGALAIFERDPKIVWAGSGEQNNRQSSSWGGGGYRSTDAGETWTYLGLHDTRSIARVVLDPNDANV